MAELTATNSIHAAQRPIPARAQLFAVAWLRWRIFVNNAFRRRPATGRQAVGLAFAILLRMIVWPFLAMMAVGPVIGSGFLAWMAITENHPQNLAGLLAGITLLWQFVSINGLNIAAAVSSFDPSTLIRFPLRFGRYLVLRTLFGLLTPSTIVGCLASLAAAVGIGVAKPELALPALSALGIYALMNIFLTRMIEAWLERWFANRRFREFFGIFMALSAVGFQYLNFQRAPLHGHAAAHSLMLDSLRGPGTFLKWLPPGFAANAILLTGHPWQSLTQFAALLASTALFAVAFAIRLHKQFLGEYLNEGGIWPAPAQVAVRRRAAAPLPVVVTAIKRESSRVAFSPIVGACLRKEWLMFRGNGSQLVGLLTPLVFIVILDRSAFAQRPAYFLPGAIAYALVGILAGLYNTFGADGLGVQVYLLAPVRLRDVIVAKNLVSMTVIVVQAGLAWTLVVMLAHSRIPLSTQIATALWTGFVIVSNLALGTLRSIQTPRRYIPGQTRQRRGTPTTRTSGLLIFFMLFGSMALQVPVVLLSRYFHQPWLAALIFAPFAGAALLSYALILRNAEKMILTHRDVFAEELCKV